MDGLGDPADRVVLTPPALDRLLTLVRAEGYRLVGPTVRDGAIVHDEIQGIGDLPAGWTEIQEAGRYRLARRDDRALFGYAVGPHSWKQFFHVPRVTLWKARRDGTGGFEVVTPAADDDRPLALLGARSCDLHAIAIQDRVLAENDYVDEAYAARRAGTLVLAVNCGTAGGTCFCTSMETGPQVTSGHDLVFTELIDTTSHRFLTEIGSTRGAALVGQVPHEPADAGTCRVARTVVDRTASQMGRSLDTADIKNLLYRNLEHPRWDDVASRCLACTNCTMVCPTCFCTTVEDVTDLAGQEAEHVRRWDSCFSESFTDLHGGHVRGSIAARYRQWMTHKLATWIDQFGSSGCVGCGRCITWCPVGIDITAEAAAIRDTDHRRHESTPEMP